jgi:hypothetical protein
MRVEAGIRVAVAGARLGVGNWVGERTGGKVGAGGMKAGGRRMRYIPTVPRIPITPSRLAPVITQLT